MDNGVPGEDVIAMRISLGPSGQPSISDGNASTIEDMLKELLSQSMEVCGVRYKSWGREVNQSCDCSSH